MPLPCKPDSVPSAICGSGQPFIFATITRRFCGRVTLLLFCLAPCGVCPATSVAFGAVGSYPTFSPLPSEPGGLFSATLSVRKS